MLNSCERETMLTLCNTPQDKTISISLNIGHATVTPHATVTRLFSMFQTAFLKSIVLRNLDYESHFAVTRRSRNRIYYRLCVMNISKSPSSAHRYLHPPISRSRIKEIQSAPNPQVLYKLYQNCLAQTSLGSLKQYFLEVLL